MSSRLYLGCISVATLPSLGCVWTALVYSIMLTTCFRARVSHTHMLSLPLANNLTPCRRTIEVWPRNSSAGECRRDRRVRLVAHCTCSTPRVRPLPSAYTLGSCRGDGFGMVALRIVLLWVFCSTAACRYALRSTRTHWCCVRSRGGNVAECLLGVLYLGVGVLAFPVLPCLSSLFGSLFRVPGPS